MVEISLGEDQISEEGSVVSTTSRSWSKTLSLLVLGALLVAMAGLLVVPGLTGSGSASADDAESDTSDDDAPTGDTATSDSPTDDSRESGASDSPSPDSRSEAAVLVPEPGDSFPIFEESPGLTMVVRTNDGLALVNTDDGSRRVLPVADYPDEGSEVFGHRFDPALQFESSLVIRNGSGIEAYSLTDDRVVDYGVGGTFWLSRSGDQLHILRGDLWSDSFKPGDRVIDTFGIDHRPLGDSVEIPDKAGAYIFPMGDGLFTSGGNGVYEFRDGSFERITRGSPWAVGRGHVAVHDCDDTLECAMFVVDRATAETASLDLGSVDQVFPLESVRISPNGQHVLFGDEDAQQIKMLGPDGVSAWGLDSNFDLYGDGFQALWTPDSKYLVVRNGQALRVVDVAGQTIAEHRLEDLVLEQVRAVVGVLELGESAS